MRKIRVLVVDDSALARRILCEIIGGEPDFEVVGTAKDGVEAIRKTGELDPDVIALDLFMPEMDGLAALEYIMKKDPRPVLIVSSLARKGAVHTLRALELGAVDFIAKPTRYPTSLTEIRSEILHKLKAAAFSRARSWKESKVRMPEPLAGAQARRGEGKGVKKIVVIGASAGGPKAVTLLLGALPGDIGVPVVIVQHMPAQFTSSFAARLNRKSRLSVLQAGQGEQVRPNVALVAPGGHDLKFRRVDGSGVLVDLMPSCGRHGVSPVIDVTMESAADTFGSGAVGVLLSGMGQDGAEGLGKIKAAGGFTIAQDEETSLVFGMPRAAIERGFAEKVVPIEEMANVIVSGL